MEYAASLEELLRCPSCKLLMTADACYILPCQHSFCRSCLRSTIYYKKVLRCPDCDLLVETPLDQLPPSRTLVQLMEFVATIKPPPKELTPKQQRQEEKEHQEWLNRMKQPFPEGPIPERPEFDIDLADLNGFDLMWNEDDLVTYDDDEVHANDVDPYLMDFEMYGDVDDDDDDDEFDMYEEEPADGA